MAKRTPLGFHCSLSFMLPIVLVASRSALTFCQLLILTRLPFATLASIAHSVLNLYFSASVPPLVVGGNSILFFGFQSSSCFSSTTLPFVNVVLRYVSFVVTSGSARPPCSLVTTQSAHAPPISTRIVRHVLRCVLFIVTSESARPLGSLVATQNAHAPPVSTLIVRVCASTWACASFKVDFLPLVCELLTTFRNKATKKWKSMGTMLRFPW